MADTRYVTHDTWKSLASSQVTYPNGRQVASGYDALYRRNAVTETSGGTSIAQWQFFGNRTATTVLGNGLTCSMMNNAGTNSAVQPGVANPPWGDNTTDRLGYDGSGRLIAKRFLPPGSTTSLVGFSTAYDPSSNKLYERALQAESRSALYPRYDSMDRLREYQRGMLAFNGGSVATEISLPGTDSTRSYDLDGLGNWKKTVYTPEGATTPTTEIRQHNKLNEITQFAGTPVLYDHGNNAGNPNPLIAQRGNGNITDDGTRLYAYDALNRLVSVTRKSDGVRVAAYVYDTLGRRAHKIVTNGGISGTVSNTTSRYIYDGQQIAEELDGSNSTVRQFIWGQYIDELVQIKTYVSTGSQPLVAGIYYPLQDLLYRTAALTDSSHAIVEAYDYDAYGNTLIFPAPVGTDWWADTAATTLQPACEFLFTGRQYDPETEIYWYRTRYYGTVQGRFLGKDSYGYRGGINLYEFIQGSPTKFVDPFGLLIFVFSSAETPNAGVEVARAFQEIIPLQCGKVEANWTGSYWTIKLTKSKNYDDFCRCYTCFQRLNDVVVDPIAAIIRLQSTDQAGASLASSGYGATSATSSYIDYNYLTTHNLTVPGLHDTPVDDPFSIVLWHEVVGHAYDTMKTGSSGHVHHTDDPIVWVENLGRWCRNVNSSTIFQIGYRNKRYYND